jgi:hypothetical protein
METIIVKEYGVSTCLKVKEEYSIVCEISFIISFDNILKQYTILEITPMQNIAALVCFSLNKSLNH